MTGSRRPSRASLATLLGGALAAGTLAAVGAPPAQAAFTPTKASTITVGVDGMTLGISNTVVDLSGARSGVFGGGVTPASGSSPGTNELTEMYPVKGGAFTNFLARGGVVKKTGGSCGAGGTYYRQSQVTIGNLPTGTKDVWLFYDPTIGPNIGAPTPYFNGPDSSRLSLTSQLEKLCDGTTPYASGATGTTAAADVVSLGGSRQTAGLRAAGVTGSTASFNVYVPLAWGVAGPTENFIGLGIVVDAVDTITNVARASNVATITTAAPHGYSVGQKVLIDASNDSFDTALATITGVTSTTFTYASAGADVASTAATGTVSAGFLDSSSDTAIFTHVYAPPWNAGIMPGITEVDLPTCSSPAAGDAPCVDTSATGLFASDGSSALSGSPTSTVEAMFGSMGPGQSIMNVSMGLTSPSSTGYAVPTMSIAKVKISLPTTGTYHGVDFGSVNFANSAGNTTLRIDPAATDGLNTWNMTTSGDRRIITVVGQARTTSTAVNRQTWQENCEITITSNVTSTTGCGEGLTSSVGATQMVLSSVPVRFGLSYSTDPTMQTIAGGMVSTNAQSMKFGEETMAGTSFQFAVAGPSYDASDASRSTDGFYFVCIPQAFLAGSFNTTPASAAQTWIGTRDGTQTTGVSFSASTCGIGPGLLASYPEFGYSAPLFRVKPPTPASSGGGSSSSATETATTSTTTTTTIVTPTVVTTPIVVQTVTPAVYPALAADRPVRPSYLLGLAKWRPGPQSKVSFSIPKMYRSVCRIVDGKVKAVGTGTCGVRITLIGPKGKTASKRVYLSAQA